AAVPPRTARRRAGSTPPPPARRCAAPAAAPPDAALRHAGTTASPRRPAYPAEWRRALRTRGRRITGRRQPLREAAGRDGSVTLSRACLTPGHVPTGEPAGGATAPARARRAR